jgi:glycerol-3-phosphate O-acyltransferase/dihydroxyacetone phosphate acyltransferase
MTWLDERIFGWSRSAGGQAVWDPSAPISGHGRDRSRSNPSTAPASPAESDDEEEEADVDYDDVLAIIDTKERRPGAESSEPVQPGSPRMRKKGGRSYHDLTSIREAKAFEAEAKSPTAQAGELPRVDDELPGLTLRKGARKP